MRIKGFLKDNWHILTVMALALVFFAGTSFYNSQVLYPDFLKWGSPDENANYVFIETYSQTGDFRIFEKHNLYSDEIIRTRSIRSDDGYLKPVSFLGMPIIYGNICKVFGLKVAPFITPFLGSLGVIFFYLLVKEVFGRRNSLISTFLMASFPVYVYYTARSMFHNIPFTVFLIMALYFLVIMNSEKVRKKETFLNLSLSQLRFKYKYWIFAALGGTFLGLALAVRTSEALWLLPMVFILWLFNIRKTGITKLFLVAGFCFLALLPVGYWNQILFGSPISGGYPEMNESIHSLGSSGGELVSSTFSVQLDTFKQVFRQAINTVFYFGFDPERSWETFNDYFVKMFPGLFFFALLGLFLFLQFWHKRGKAFWAFLFSYLTVSLILIFYYGSWVFHDNPDATRTTIGNSYTRYWLPVYLGAIPLASFFIIKLGRGLFPVEKNRISLYRQKNTQKLQHYLDMYKKESRFSLRTSVVVNGIRVVVVSVFVIFSLVFLLYGSEEGLVHGPQRAEAERQMFKEVLRNTEKDAAIITYYHDKTLFPERRVIYGLFDDMNMIERYSRIAENLPLYYFNFSLRQEDLDYLNSGRLGGFGLEIQEVKQISPDFTLYKLRQSEYNQNNE